MGKGGLHLNARHSQEDVAGSEMGDNSRSCRWMTDKATTGASAASCLQVTVAGGAGFI